MLCDTELTRRQEELARIALISCESINMQRQMILDESRLLLGPLCSSFVRNRVVAALGTTQHLSDPRREPPPARPVVQLLC